MLIDGVLGFGLKYICCYRLLRFGLNTSVTDSYGLV